MDFNSKKGSGAARCAVGISIGFSKGSLRMEKLYYPVCSCSTWKVWGKVVR